MSISNVYYKFNGNPPRYKNLPVILNSEWYRGFFEGFLLLTNQTFIDPVQTSNFSRDEPN